MSKLSELVPTLNYVDQLSTYIYKLLHRSIELDKNLFIGVEDESSFRDSNLLTSKISHACDYGYSVPRGINQKFKLFNSVSTSVDFKINKFDLIGSSGQYKLYSLYNYVLSEIPIDLNIVVAKDIITKTYTINVNQSYVYVLDNDISDELVIKCNGEEINPVIMTIPEYGVIILNSDNNYNQLFSAGDTLEVKYFKYVESNIDSDKVKLSNISFDSINSINYVSPLTDKTTIYNRSLLSYLCNGRQYSYNTIKYMIANYFTNIFSGFNLLIKNYALTQISEINVPSLISDSELKVLPFIDDNYIKNSELKYNISNSQNNPLESYESGYDIVASSNELYRKSITEEYDGFKKAYIKSNYAELDNDSTSLKPKETSQSPDNYQIIPNTSSDTSGKVQNLGDYYIMNVIQGTDTNTKIALYTNDFQSFRDVKYSLEGEEESSYKDIFTKGFYVNGIYFVSIENSSDSTHNGIYVGNSLDSLVKILTINSYGLISVLYTNSRYILNYMTSSTDYGIPIYSIDGLTNWTSLAKGLPGEIRYILNSYYSNVNYYNIFYHDGRIQMYKDNLVYVRTLSSNYYWKTTIPPVKYGNFVAYVSSYGKYTYYIRETVRELYSKYKILSMKHIGSYLVITMNVSGTIYAYRIKNSSTTFEIIKYNSKNLVLQKSGILVAGNTLFLICSSFVYYTINATNWTYLQLLDDSGNSLLGNDLLNILYVNDVYFYIFNNGVYYYNNEAKFTKLNFGVDSIKTANINYITSYYTIYVTDSNDTKLSYIVNDLNSNPIELKYNTSSNIESIEYYIEIDYGNYYLASYIPNYITNFDEFLSYLKSPGTIYKYNDKDYISIGSEGDKVILSELPYETNDNPYYGIIDDKDSSKLHSKFELDSGTYTFNTNKSGLLSVFTNQKYVLQKVATGVFEFDSIIPEISIDSIIGTTTNSYIRALRFGVNDNKLKYELVRYDDQKYTEDYTTITNPSYNYYLIYYKSDKELDLENYANFMKYISEPYDILTNKFKFIPALPNEFTLPIKIVSNNINIKSLVNDLIIRYESYVGGINKSESEEIGTISPYQIIADIKRIDGVIKIIALEKLSDYELTYYQYLLINRSSINYEYIN